MIMKRNKFEDKYSLRFLPSLPSSYFIQCSLCYYFYLFLNFSVHNTLL